MTSSGPNLSVGNYSIEMNSQGFGIYIQDALDNKELLATAKDPETAMDIIEGLVMVVTKRYYYPDSAPVFTSEGGKPLPPFLNKGGS